LNVNQYLWPIITIQTMSDKEDNTQKNIEQQQEEQVADAVEEQKQE